MRETQASLGEGTRFIGADVRNATHVFNCYGSSYQCMQFCETVNAKGEEKGECDREFFRNGSGRERHRAYKRIEPTVSLHQSCCRENQTKQSRPDQQNFDQTANSKLHRSCFVRGTGRGLDDLAILCLGTCENDSQPGGARQSTRASEAPVLLFDQRISPLRGN